MVRNFNLCHRDYVCITDNNKDIIRQCTTICYSKVFITKSCVLNVCVSVTVITNFSMEDRPLGREI